MKPSSNYAPASAGRQYDLPRLEPVEPRKEEKQEQYELQTFPRYTQIFTQTAQSEPAQRIERYQSALVQTHASDKYKLFAGLWKNYQFN